jgi:hypothetical protein
MRLGGNLVDVSALEFQIFDKVIPASPVQVYPNSGRALVDIANDCPIGDRIGTGHYLAKYTVPAAAPTGTYELRWFFRLTSSTPEQEFREEFEVLPNAVPASGGYTTLAVMRAEGVPASISDDRLQYLIFLAAAYTDRYTGRWFEPRTADYTLDGSGTVSMLLEQPVIAIDTVYIDDLALAAEDVVVYNRHISQNLTDPDDRENPKIELEQALNDELLFKIGRKIFYRGQQNVRITGVFGYTEFDGSSTGSVPLLISRVSQLLVMRNMRTLYNSGPTDTTLQVARITELRTRDQWIRYADPNRLGLAAPGPFTGDREIDNILMSFRRPPKIRAV